MISYEPLFRTMQERGISSYRLEKMGFSRATYYAIKSGQSVSTNTIDRPCHLLQCRVEDVMEHIEEDRFIARASRYGGSRLLFLL